MIYEWQFFDNYQETNDCIQLVKELRENFDQIPEDLKVKLDANLSTGFINWSIKDYNNFKAAFKKYDIQDLESFSRDIDTKTVDEVRAYLDVFLRRFRELKEKEKELVLNKAKEGEDISQANLQTIYQFDKSKNYAILMQENHYFNRNHYLATLEKEHQRLVDQNRRPTHSLQLKLDHFYHA